MDRLEPTWKGLDSAYDVEANTNIRAEFDLSKFKPRPNGSREDPPWVVEKTAIDSQVGGTHYKNQGIQPLEATFKNFGYEGLRASVYTKVGKYLTREKGTHKQDIEKAIHVLQIQLEYLDRGEE